MNKCTTFISRTHLIVFKVEDLGDRFLLKETDLSRFILGYSSIYQPHVIEATNFSRCFWTD